MLYVVYIYKHVLLIYSFRYLLCFSKRKTGLTPLVELLVIPFFGLLPLQEDGRRDFRVLLLLIHHFILLARLKKACLRSNRSHLLVPLRPLLDATSQVKKRSGGKGLY